MKQSKIEKKNLTITKIVNFFVAFYFFMTYFEPYLNSVIGSVFKYYMFFVILVILFTNERLTLHGYHYAILGWLLYKFMSLAWTTDFAIFKLHYVSQLGVVALLICMTALPESEERNKIVQTSIWLGSFIIGVLSLFFSKDYAEDYSSRQVLELFGYQNDPNNQAAFLLFGVALSFYFLFYEKKHPVLHLAVIAINSFATLLTGSRGGLLSLAAIVLSYVFTLYDKEKAKNNSKKFFGIILLVVAATALIVTVLPKDVYERLFDFDGYEGGSNRISIWNNALAMLKNPLFLLLGCGWGAYATGHGASSLHNTFLSTLCDVGILGFLLLFGVTIYATYQMLKKKNVLPFAMFVAGMVPSFFIEAINKRFFWISILFVFMEYNKHLQQDNKLEPPKKSTFQKTNNAQT